MAPLRVELAEYLQKDEVYDWEFTNPLIKIQNRSRSMDHCFEPEEPAEGEEGAADDGFDFDQRKPDPVAQPI